MNPSISPPRLYDNASCVVAGLTADANLLVNHARVSAQRYLYQYGEQMPLEQLVKEVCNYKQVWLLCGEVWCGADTDDRRGGMDEQISVRTPSCSYEASEAVRCQTLHPS